MEQLRDEFLIRFRGGSLGETDNRMPEEKFQNQTLRPILKLQNDLFVEMFRNYITKYKNDFQTLSAEKKLMYIEHAIQKDIKFRNSLKGVVMALFTIEEYRSYTSNSSNLNKRMMNMLAERLKEQVQLFEEI
jgi:hypothetical protein